MLSIFVYCIIEIALAQLKYVAHFVFYLLDTTVLYMYCILQKNIFLFLLTVYLILLMPLFAAHCEQFFLTDFALPLYAVVEKNV